MTTIDIFGDEKETIDIKPESKTAKEKREAHERRLKSDKAKADKDKLELENRKVRAEETKRFHQRNGWPEYPANKNGRIQG